MTVASSLLVLFSVQFMVLRSLPDHEYVFDVISLQVSGVYRDLLSREELFIPEYVKDAETLKLFIKAWMHDTIASSSLRKAAEPAEPATADPAAAEPIAAEPAIVSPTPVYVGRQPIPQPLPAWLTTWTQATRLPLPCDRSEPRSK